jgi:hypothetical protein
LPGRERLSRRRFIQSSGALGTAAVLAGCAGTQFSSSPGVTRTHSAPRTLRIAHLTDIHATRDRGSPGGLEACLRHVYSLKDRPDVILTGGDDVMDALNATEASVASQWDVWQEAFSRHTSIPVHHCLGNHDIWGWNREASQTTGNEPRYGKEWARQVYGVDRHYRSLDLGGWHIIFLDSMTYDGGTSYYAKLDEDQFRWLQADLSATPRETPILINSHIPILSACVFYDGDNAKADWVVPRAWMHIDSVRIKDLFLEHPNVRLCISGHLHLYERVLYNDVTYVCDGAVCGGWWKGPYQQCFPGYGLIDLYKDGTFDNQYVEFGWTPPETAETTAGADREVAAAHVNTLDSRSQEGEQR